MIDETIQTQPTEQPAPPTLDFLQKRLDELDKLKPSITAFYDEKKSVLSQIAEITGFDHYFENPEGDVYKITKCKGKFVSFDEVDYCRTKRTGEVKGSLSVKEAQERGFKK